MTSERNARLCAQSRDGASADVLATEFGISLQRVYQILRAGGITAQCRQKRKRPTRFLLTEEERTALEAQATAEGVSLSALVRERCLRK